MRLIIILLIVLLIAFPLLAESIQMKDQRILVFAPHPDDDVIGCGRSIIKHSKGGAIVAIVYMTSGNAGSLDYSKEKLTELREKLGINTKK